MDRVYGSFAGLQNPKVNTSLYETRDEVNLKLYGTTDVHILTDDDIWITEDGIFEAQKVQRIDYEVVIIPHGVRHIIPKTPEYDDDSGEHFYEEGVYPIWINAKKIICPNTLLNIYASLNQSYYTFCDIKTSGDFVLNEGVQIINLFNENEYLVATEMGNITIPKTLKSFTVCEYTHDITIPHDVDKFSLWYAEPLKCNLYVYNPNFDFSDFTINVVELDNTDSGVLHGYAGSTAEAFAKEHGYTFKNLGSSGGGGGADVSGIEEALDRIIAIQNELLGGDA